MSTLIGSKALKCSPRCDTLPRRSTTSSLFATPLGSPGRSPAPVSTDPKPTEMSHRGDLPTGSESDVCTFKCSSMWTSVRRNLLPEGLSFLAGTTGAVVAGAMNPLFAYLMILAIPDLYANSRHEIAKQTDKISLKIMGLGVIAVLSNAIQHYHFGRAGEMTSWRLKQKSFEGLLRSEVAWFDREENASSMLTARVSSNALLVKDAVTDRLPSFVQCLTAIVVALTISFLLEWRMALVCVATFPIYMAGWSIKQGFQKTGFAGDLQLSFEKATAVAGEAVRNIRTVASFGAEDKLLALFDAQLVQHKKTIFVQSQKGGILFGISQWAMFAANALALWYASALVKQKHATFAAVLQTFQVLAWTGFFLAEALSLIPDLAKGYTAAASMCQAIHRVSGIEPDNGKTPETVQGEARLVNVIFHYPSRPDATVLQELSLYIAAGTTHALVGSSGSGKSTTLSLVLRFYDPTGGQVLIDGADLRTLHLRWLRQQIGWVQQEPVLFQGTIKMNILYANDKASEAEVVAAAKLANAYSFISSLPQGFDPEVGEQGVQLSGGQKQRVAIARAVLKNPSVMLLDEATSALDTQSERIVQEALNNIMRSNRTTIVIAHRLSSVRQADKISVMDHGKVVEEGTHDYLTVAGGLYSRLCSLQEVAQ